MGLMDTYRQTDRQTHSLVVLLSLQSLSDVGDGLDGRLELVRQGHIGAGPVYVLLQVRAHALRLVPAHTHTKQTDASDAVNSLY